MNGKKITPIILLLPLWFLFQYACQSGEQKNRTPGDEAAASYRADTAWINRALISIQDREIENADSEQHLIQAVKDKAESTGYRQALARALLEEGTRYYAANRFEEAKNRFNQVIGIAREIKDTLLITKGLLELGSVELTTGDDHLSLKLYYEALPMLEKIGYKTGIAKVYNIIGLYKCGQGEYDTAISYYQRAMALNLETGNETGLIHNQGNLAYLYELTGKFSEAEDIYLELEKKLVLNGDRFMLPVIYADLASVSRKKGLRDDAIGYLKKAVALCESTGDTACLAGNYGDLGEQYFTIQRYDLARHFMEKSIRCARVVNDPEIELAATEFIMKIDSAQGNFKLAYEQYRTIKVLQDSISSRKNRYHLKSSELGYQNQKKDLELEIRELQVQKEKKQSQILVQLFLMALIILLTGSAVVIFYLRDIRRKHRIVQDELTIKNLQVDNAAKNEELHQIRINRYEESLKMKELSEVSQALALEQKNELLNLIRNKILSSMGDSGTLGITELNSLLASIRLQINDKEDADLFNQKFHQVHPDFYERLTKAHPDLTRSELRFCAYLKLNLTSHQISGIMNVTAEAIRKNRYRIRKKLHLNREESLERYLSAF